MSRIREQAEIKLAADTTRAVEAIERARRQLHAANTLHRLRTMLNTALYQDKEPVRWKISRLVARQLRAHARETRTDGPGPIQMIFGIPVEVDEDTPVGFGLVVR